MTPQLSVPVIRAAEQPGNFVEPQPEWLANLPCEDEFPRRPATWYLFCRTRDLARGPLSKNMLGRRLVAYRAVSGQISVLDAACVHLGADLGRGRVVGEELECPFHHWRYASSGRCLGSATCEHTSKDRRLRAYPTVERHGYVFFFYGPQPLFSLPFFPNCDPDDFAASPVFSFEANCAWSMLVSNAFDVQHFRAVHDRKLLDRPEVDCPAPYARRMQFEAEVLSVTVFDRLLRIFVGKRVRTSMTSWGGALVLVEGQFAKAHSRILIASQPLDDNRTLCEVMAIAPRHRGSVGAAIDWVGLHVRRRFTQAFLQKDTDKLSGIRYQCDGLTEGDKELVAYFRWLTTLPQSEYEDLP